MMAPALVIMIMCCCCDQHECHSEEAYDDEADMDAAAADRGSRRVDESAGDVTSGWRGQQAA